MTELKYQRDLQRGWKCEEATKEDCRTVSHVCGNAVRKPKTPVELRLARNIKGNKKSSCNYSSSIRIHNENVDSVLNRLTDSSPDFSTDTQYFLCLRLHQQDLTGVCA